jgi:hypothetical protein
LNQNTHENDRGGESELDAAILRKIDEMEDPDYRFPKRFSRKDYILTASVALICLVLIFVGARL